MVYLTLFPPDIYHITYYDRIPFHNRRTKIVISVYDMIHELYPEQFSEKASQIKKECVKAADLVICISENTKKDLIQIFGIEENKIRVIYLGFKEFDHSNNIDPSIPSILPNSYILFVGQRQGYKNFEGLAKAYAYSSELNQKFQLVCFGGGQFTEEENVMIRKFEIEGKVIQIDGDDNLLKICYEKAFVFVYPSLYEGFGIPPLEAMSCGTPVCCSNTSSLPEVVGDAAILFNPLYTEEIKLAMLEILNSIVKRQELIAKGMHRIKYFTWKKCASETLDAYQSIL
ncbi:glycosyltransferase family 4 protein [Aquirufa ecclesiirivi]|uniref:glycosyltransferase family 4 protein n=1 Tax=Aquirufa ecclesiirivi TaxID=2715124 RepID=UPI0039EC8E70